tara:strand:+ start:413 stop:1549 length:1137 start_codon:yes stop_codon:yes gene_type:complete
MGIWSAIMGGKNTGNKDAQSKKSWQSSGNVPDNQSKQRTQLDRLTAKYGEGFKDTSQGKLLSGYIDNVSVNRGGNMGADNDSFYTTGDDEADEYRYDNLSGDLDVSDIKGINTTLARKGLSNEDYFKYNQFLREKNTNAYDKARPISSGKLIGTLGSSLFPGGGIMKLLKQAKNASFNKAKGLVDRTGITDTQLYKDVVAAPSGFVGDFKNLITGGRGEDDEISLDVEAIKEKKKNKKIANLNTDTDTNNAVMAMANTKSNITPYNFNANQVDFNALRGNRSLDFSELAGAPNTGPNTVGIGGVNLDNTAYNNYLANKANFADTSLNNTNMVNEMIGNPTLLNRGSPTGLNYNALGEVSNPQDLDASLGYEFLNNRIV